MIGLVGNNSIASQKTNFGAIIPVGKIRIANKGETKDAKEIQSALNTLVNILLKKEKSEFIPQKSTKDPDIRQRNFKIRDDFKQKIKDYYIPYGYSAQAKSPGDSAEKVRLFTDHKTGDSFILTGKEALDLDKASANIKQANSIDNWQDRQAAVEAAKRRYGYAIGDIMGRVENFTPKIFVWGQQSKTGKVVPTKIGFSDEVVQGSLF
jgi:hypothetical protein